MFKKFKNLFSYKKVNFKEYNLPHEALYKKILVQSYNDWFFNDLEVKNDINGRFEICLLYTSPSPRDGLLSRMPSSA